MNHSEMLENLKEQEKILKEDLIALEQQFSFKKEEYLKILGAIEALEKIGSSEEE